MACKKSELVGAINSFATARASGDNALQQMSAQLLQNTMGIGKLTLPIRQQV